MPDLLVKSQTFLSCPIIAICDSWIIFIIIKLFPHLKYEFISINYLNYDDHEINEQFWNSQSYKLVFDSILSKIIFDL